MEGLGQHQLDAINKIKPGCILCGEVGSGKSRAALAWFYYRFGGRCLEKKMVRMKGDIPELYIITTAKKRDNGEWEDELNFFNMSTDLDISYYKNKIVIDSWNKIDDYKDVKDAYFIFDEQRVIGKGAWVNAFLKIAKNNVWILLSATPGDCWTDYIPVFIANGFYKNRSEFTREHIIYKRFSKFPQIERYFNTGRLIRLRSSILVDMPVERPTERHYIDIMCSYDIVAYKQAVKERFNHEKDRPYQSASEMCYELRKIINSSSDRIVKLKDILSVHRRCIIFYNYDYELDILRKVCEDIDITYSEWNGHKHESIPNTYAWVYLVQYTAGAEGWNCIKTNTIIFYSQTYSYKSLSQACGRIDRLNTPYIDLYYYTLKSSAPIERAIAKSLKEKKEFNAGSFIFKSAFKRSNLQ